MPEIATAPVASANVPTLLNEDGTASMATPLLMSHHGFRRDIARFAVALRRVCDGDRSRVSALEREWQGYRGALHSHHMVEDQNIFPSVRAQDPSLGAVIDQLVAQHHRIDPLLESGDRAFAGLAQPQEAALIVGQLSALLDEHLALEEAHVIPFLREARQFPPPATEAEAAMYADGFAWCSHGVAPEVLDRVYAMLPEILRGRLPAARAAFQERCDRAWGPTKSGASRTAVPDWLTP